MKRFLNAALSLVLVLGLMPSIALAEDSGASAAAPPVDVSLDVGGTVGGLVALPATFTSVTPSVAGGTATLPDSQLYAAVCEQLTEQGIVFTTDNASTISLDATQMAALTSLDVSHSNVTDLAGIEAFTQLTSLKAFDNELTVQGLASLGGLSKLTYLDISRNHITDPTEVDASTATTAKALAPLANLEYLDVSHNAVRYTQDLASLVKLKHLDFFDNSLVDFSGLQGLGQLTYLDLGENNTASTAYVDTSLAALDGLSNLTYFCFSQNKTPAIATHIANMQKLTMLRLENNGIQDISSLANMHQMQTLVLSNNSVSGVQALLNMPALVELYLNGNKLYAQQEGVDTSGLEGIFSGDNLVWPALKKIDISDNYEWKFRGSGMGPRLFALDQQGKIELGYDYERLYQVEDLSGTDYDNLVVRNTRFADLPHEDANGVKYVTYDDFGAKADGSYDDYIAMHNAHAYANRRGCEVRADGSKTYHIFKTYNVQWYNCATNVDWQGATFVIHDENVDSLSGRNVPLLCMWPSPANNVAQGSWRSAHNDIVTMTSDNADPTLRPDVGIFMDTTKLAGTNFQAQLDKLSSLGYEKFYVQAFDSTTKHYIRFGHNYAGSDQTDGFIVDAQGNLIVNPNDPAANKPQWVFDPATNPVTKLVISPIPSTQAYVKNATFVWNQPSSKSEIPYPHPKGMTYYYRNFQLRDCTNVKVSNIRNYVGTPDTNYDNNEKSGSYYGNLQVFNAAQIVVEDSHFFARKFGDAARSTYGLIISDTVDVLVKNCTCNPESMLDNKRWGVTGNNRDKDLTYDHCELNRIDAHEGYCNMKALDCTIGIHAFRLTGQGPLTIERCKIMSTYLISLRQDYGSTWDTWDGQARIIDCTLEYHGQYSQGLIDCKPAYDDEENLVVHEFGYPLRYPNVYVENLTVDEKYSDPVVTQGREDFHVIPNYTYNKANLLPASYWPDWVTINGITFKNWENIHSLKSTEGHVPYFYMTDQSDGPIGETAPGRSERSYWVGKVKVLDGGTGGTDVTEALLEGEALDTNKSVLVTLDTTDADSISNTYDVRRNGAYIERGVPITGAIERPFTVPGNYEVLVHSSDSRKGWQATRTLKVNIGEGPTPAVGEKLLYTRTITLDGSAVPTAGSVKTSNYLGIEPADVVGKEVTVRFQGSNPVMHLRQDGVTTQGVNGWLYNKDLQPTSVEDLGNGWKLAHFKEADITAAWASANPYNGAYDNNDWQTGTVTIVRGDYNRLMFTAPASGTCTFDRVTLVGGSAEAHPGKDLTIAGKTADQIVQDMKAGWNLGNTLDAYEGTDDGPDRELNRGDLETEVFWSNPKTSFKTIQFIHEHGFNAVRVPVSWFQHIYDDGVDADNPNRSAVHKYHIDEAWLARVRQVVDYCYDQGMYVTLNTHHEKFWLETPQFGNADARPAMKEELAAIWTQLATEFADYDQRLVFEGLNEPRATGDGISHDREWEGSDLRDTETLNQLNQTFVDTVRSVNQGYNGSRLLVVNTVGSATNLRMLSQLRVPNDSCIAVSMHVYQPWAFCASVDHASSDYQFTTSVYDEVIEVALDQILYRAYATFTSKGIPVVLDEFSAADKGNTAERLKWMKHYIDVARGYGMTCFLWDGGGTGSNEDGYRSAYVERSTEPLQWASAAQEMVATALVTTATSKDAVAWKSAFDQQVPTGVPEGRKVNSATVDFADRSSVSYQAKWDDLKVGGVAVEFTGKPPVFYLSDNNDNGSAAGSGWMGLDPSYVEWNAGATGGVAYWYPEHLGRLWATGNVAGTPNTTSTIAKFILSGGSGVVATQVVLVGLAPAPDVSDGGYGDGTSAVRRLYTRPYTLHSSTAEEYSVRIDLSNPAIDWDSVTDIAVRYSGDTPKLVFTDDWSDWKAYSTYLDVTVPDVENQRVAFFRVSDFGAQVKAATLPMLRVMLNEGTVAKPKACSLVEVVAMGGRVPAAPSMRAVSDTRTRDQILYDLRMGYHLKGHFESESTSSGKDGGYSNNEADINVEAYSTNRCYVTKKMLSDLAAAGFTTVSVPVSWRQHIYETEDNPYQIDRAWIDRLHEVVDWAYGAGLSVVVDVHDSKWLDRTGLATDEQKAQAELVAIWRQLAQEFAGYDQRLVFQALNEPKLGTAETLNSLNQTFVDTVRAVPGNEHRMLLVPTFGESTARESTLPFVLPNDESNLVAASVHNFEPVDFTRKVDAGDVEDAEPKYAENSYSSKSRETLDRTFELIRTGLTNRGIPVVVNEFGSYYSGEGLQAEREAWMDEYTSRAKEIGIPAFYSRLDRPWKTSRVLQWTAYDEAAQKWSDLAGNMFSIWSEVLGSSDTVWGSRAEIGADEHADLTSGSLLVNALPKDLYQGASGSPNRVQLSLYDGTTQLWKSSAKGVIDPAIQGKEIAVRFKGDYPFLYPSTSDWAGWPKIEPRTVLGDPTSDEGAVAYWPYETVQRLWTSTWYSKELRNMQMNDLSYLPVQTAGTTTVLDAKLLVEPHQHTWSDWVTTKDATCTEAGEKKRTCKDDSTHIETRTIAALGHLDDGGKVTREATFEQEGELTHTCLRCGTVLSITAIPKKEKADYGIVEHAEGNWTRGSGAGYTITSEAPRSKFDHVEMDGNTVAPANYDIADDTTRITLHSDYLATLPVGDHEVKVVSTDGAATATLSIEPLRVAKPTATDFIYDGKQHAGVALSDAYTLSGAFVATNVGSYTATATLNAGYLWSDGTAVPVVLVWKISEASQPSTPTPVAPQPQPQPHKTSTPTFMFRLYSPYTSEHLYTADTSERDMLVDYGWRYEGIGWKAPASSDSPVFRLYSPWTGDHHYTIYASERDMLVDYGWRYEGIGWFSASDASGTPYAGAQPLYRMYAPFLTVGQHHYTADASEADFLSRNNWNAEGIGWYALS